MARMRHVLDIWYWQCQMKKATDSSKCAFTAIPHAFNMRSSMSEMCTIHLGCMYDARDRVKKESNEAEDTSYVFVFDVTGESPGSRLTLVCPSPQCQKYGRRSAIAFCHAAGKSMSCALVVVVVVCACGSWVCSFHALGFRF